MKNLVIKECKNYEEWDEFIDKSPQHNFFSTSKFFRCSKFSHNLFFLMKNDVPLISFPVFINKNNKPSNIPFSYYQGINFSPQLSNLKYCREFSWLRYSYEIILNFLIKNFNGFYLDLHPSIVDLRYINWFLHSNRQIKNNLNIKYTAMINNRRFKSFEDIRKNYRKDRIQDLKYAEKEGFEITDKCDLNTFLKLMKETYKKNNEEVTDEIIETIELFFTNLGDSLGVISVKYKDKIIGSQIFFCDKNSGHAVAQTTNNSFIKKGVSSYLTDTLIKFIFKKRIKYLDFNGCNSPDRADFKHSFGAEPTLFFRFLSENQIA